LGPGSPSKASSKHATAAAAAAAAARETGGLSSGSGGGGGGRALPKGLNPKHMLYYVALLRAQEVTAPLE